ncbi:MAG TPA: hypothetical protein VNA69_19510 [Thermoanaerobaculia bacterium]|nr:hypothetical protein [Thermoanaerobaculia bacterium]
MLLLHEIQFRSSPFIELKSLGELAAEERERFADLERDPDFYGLLVPKPPLTMNLMSVARDTAELFQSLATPSRLGNRVLDDHTYAADVVDLVLDGILEIECGDGFVSGADALPVLCPDLPEPALPDGAARLSHDALLHAEDLASSDPRTLTHALYQYNRIPITPFWKTRFADAEAILAYLGADRGALRSLLEREWKASRALPGFLSWSSRMQVRRGPEDVTYKLYVSPRPERIREAFEVVVRVLSAFPETPFKIGSNAAGLLRPDKLMLYFAAREPLVELGEILRRELAGCDAHGVPFTAGLDDTGLLSWGVDPPESERALRWLGGNSWRYWVAKRLASALAVAKTARSAAAVAPWRFALERARRHGVDIETWTPSATLWSAA